jgi:DNA gyrase subunit A
MGVIDIQTSKRNGDVVACIVVEETDQVMMITRGGQMIRTPVAGVTIIGRNTGGVRLFSMADGDNVIGMTIVMDDDVDVVDTDADAE